MSGKIDVRVREVGMRDGLQSVQEFMPTEAKTAWCSAEAAAGMPEIEVCSFVPPKLLPQFADAAEVVAHALGIPGLTVAALTPNLKGAERGIAAGVHKLNYVVSVSEKHNQANVRRTRAESIEDFGRIAALIRTLPAEKRPTLAAGLATALGCTLEGASLGGSDRQHRGQDGPDARRPPEAESGAGHGRGQGPEPGRARMEAGLGVHPRGARPAREAGPRAQPAREAGP